MASTKVDATWLELSMRIKTAYAQYYLASENEKLTREVLELMSRLESVAQARYAGGLARSRMRSAPRWSRPPCARTW